MLIPRIAETIRYIEKELDEMDREDFYRLKKVQDKKKIMKEKALRAKEKLQEKMEKLGIEEPTSSMLQEDDDEDVVF